MDEQKNHQLMQVGKTTCACGADCNCGCGHRSGHHLIRWAVGLFIIFAVFVVGVKVGEFITRLSMGFYGGYGRAYPAGMMQNQGYYYGGAPVPQTSTSSPSAGIQVNP